MKRPASLVFAALFVWTFSFPKGAGADPGGPPAATPAAPAATAAASAAPAPTATPLNIAFDQVDRTLGGASTPPPLTAFADEVQAAKDAQTAAGGIPVPGMSASDMAISMIPVVGTIYGMHKQKQEMDAAKRQEQAMQDQMNGNTPPVLTRYAFYNGWTRVETTDSVVIGKPDQHETIFLDLKAKTYRTYDMSGPAQTQAAASPAANVSGQANAMSLISMSQADGETIDGVDVTGYSTEAIVTLSGSSGSCHDGTFRAKQLVYLAKVAEPVPQPQAGSLDLLALPDGCSATMQRQVSGAPAPASQMYVYRLTTVTRDPNAPTQSASGNSIDFSAMMQHFQGGAPSGGHPPNYMIFSQRGNIRQLTAADAGLFDIPAGFTQDQ